MNTRRERPSVCRIAEIRQATGTPYTVGGHMPIYKSAPAFAPHDRMELRPGRPSFETMTRTLTILVVLSTFLAGTLRPAGAGQTAPVIRNPGVRAQVTAVGGSTNAVVAGQTLDSAGAPLPFVPVRIRNLDTAEIVGQSTSNHLAEFSFLVPGGPTYVVELIEKKGGQVLAVSPAVTTKAGEAVGVIVKLPAKLPTMAGFFGNTAAAILSAASAAGITAVTATGNPVTPEQ